MTEEGRWGGDDWTRPPGPKQALRNQHFSFWAPRACFVTFWNQICFSLLDLQGRLRIGKMESTTAWQKGKTSSNKQKDPTKISIEHFSATVFRQQPPQWTFGFLRQKSEIERRGRIENRKRPQGAEDLRRTRAADTHTSSFNSVSLKNFVSKTVENSVPLKILSHLKNFVSKTVEISVPV